MRSLEATLHSSPFFTLDIFLFVCFQLQLVLFLEYITNLPSLSPLLFSVLPASTPALPLIRTRKSPGDLLKM